MARNYISTTTMDIEVFNYLKFKNIDNNVCLRCVRTVQTKHINDFPESYLDLSIPERLDFIHSLCGNEYFRKNLEKNIIKQKTSPYSYKSESKSRTATTSPFELFIGTTTSLNVVELQAMCSGLACTSGTSCVSPVLAAAPQMPLS